MNKPKGSGDKIKTDHRDARMLALLHGAGELTAMHVPKYYSFEFRADRSLYFVGPEEERNGALQCKLIE